jgi:hypothetical protein
MEATYNRERYEQIGEIISAITLKTELVPGLVSRLANDLGQLTDETVNLLYQICKKEE